MARHARNDEGPRTLELGKLVAGGAHGDGAWEEDREPRRIWPWVLTLTASLVATVLGWSLAGALNPDPPPASNAVPVVETVTLTPSPVPTVTRWRTRTPSPGKPAVVTMTPAPAPTVTRWRVRTSSPSPAPTVTVVRTRYLTPPGGDTDDDPSTIPGHADTRDGD